MTKKKDKSIVVTKVKKEKQVKNLVGRPPIQFEPVEDAPRDPIPFDVPEVKVGFWKSLGLFFCGGYRKKPPVVGTN